MNGTILAASVDGNEYLKFKGAVRYSHCAGLEAYIDELFARENIKLIIIDLEEAEILDSTALGLLARIAIEYRRISDKKPTIFLKNSELKNIIKRVCFDQVFELIYDRGQKLNQEFLELSKEQQDEEQVLKRVLDAHKNLAQLDAENESLYRDITKVLN